jgi:hypothetical protein
VKVGSVVVVVLALAFVGCGGSEPDAATTTSTTSPPADSSGSASRFAVRPVLSVSGPPCPEDTVPGVATNAGACFGLGPVAVDGDDVAWATKTPSVIAGTSVVQSVALEVHLTDDGLDRFNELAARAVDRQLALLVDGAVVSAPTVLTTRFSGAISVVGLDEPDIDRFVADFPKR